MTPAYKLCVCAYKEKEVSANQAKYCSNGVTRTLEHSNKQRETRLFSFSVRVQGKEQQWVSANQAK